MRIASPLDGVKVSRSSVVKLHFVCVVAHDLRFRRWATAVNVKLILPPRQSRGSPGYARTGCSIDGRLESRTFLCREGGTPRNRPRNRTRCVQAARSAQLEAATSRGGYEVSLAVSLTATVGAIEFHLALGAAAGLRDPRSIRNPAHRSSRCTRCIGNNVRPHRSIACRRVRRVPSRAVSVHR